MKHRNAVGPLLAALLHAPLALADPGALLESQCASCHELDRAAWEARADSREGITAPPLWYAGDKFRRDWLEAWLQDPARIRPAGFVPADHVRATPEGDRVDEAGLPSHPALPAADAAAVAGHLAGLRPLAAQLAGEAYEPGDIALRMGQMNFGKFKGCDGCHQDEPGYGGLSGPELYTAWRRLNPAFISAWIRAPQAVDSAATMPSAGLNAQEAHKLANYLRAIGAEDIP